MLKVLELFSGTGSVGKVLKKFDWDVISLDIDERADIVCDILEWDYKKYPKDTFDIIWSSPPCDEYSIMNHCRPTKICDLESADKLVLKALEIVDYCMFDWYIRKRTRIWTNRELSNRLCNKTCNAMIDEKKHRSFSTLNIPGINRLDLRHTIPQELIVYLFL